MLLVDILSAGFGLGSWIAMTGLWVELPLLVQRLPEGWAFASQLSLFLQAANVGPILYGLFHYWWPKQVTERTATHAQLAVGALSTLLLVFMWSWTIGGRSVPFFILSFGLSLVDCTSSVVFLPFMAEFKARYLPPYLVGEGLSGLLPSLVAIAQGIGHPECINETRTVISEGENITEIFLVPHIKEPRFEPEWFFVILLGLVMLSWVAFILLDKLPSCQKEKVKESGNSFEMLPGKELQNEAVQSEERSTVLYLYLLFIQGWASIATFGIFPAIQPYSCLPYGEKPFHLTVTLCGIAYPAACFLAMFIEVRKVSWISWLTAIATIISVYAMVAAVLSPTPPLVDTSFGAYLIVFCWVTFMFIFSYIKTMATVLLGDYWGHRALFWCGAVTQAGAVIGALIMFLLVNVFVLFHDEGMCII